MELKPYARFAEQRFDEKAKTLHTPVTVDSIAKCIELTVEKWNRRDGA